MYEDFELIPVGSDAPPGADFCVNMDDDSMEPYIKSGQSIYVQRNASLEEFDVGIFLVDGKMVCRQWCVDYAGTLHLISANPRRQDANISIPRSGGKDVVCCGKVLLNQKLPIPIYL